MDRNRQTSEGIQEEDFTVAGIKLAVHAGPHRRVQCPVSAEIEVPADVSEVTMTSGGKPVPCQARRKDDALLVSWILDDLDAAATREYEVVPGSGEGGDSKGVVLSQKGDEVEVTIDGALFTCYRHGSELARPHLYPIIGPYGDGITRRLAREEDGRSMDHHHHRSIWVSHGEVNGFNNWAENEGHARTVIRELEAVEDGPVLGRIAAVGAWVGTEGWVAPGGSDELLEERTEWTFYNTPADRRIIDLRVTLTALKIDVLFGDTKEGGLAAVRVEESMEARSEPGGVIENANGGINEDETWGKRAAWCDYSGPVNGKNVGIALMDHPDSFRHPTYWHVRNYGLMTANPFGLSHYHNDPTRRGHHVLSPGQSLEGIYRFYVHSGDATEGDVRERYHDFANPPKVET
jgi:hypothetical protein